MTKEKLKQNYEKAANDYLKAFCRKHDYDYDPYAWVAGDAGGICEIADYYVDFQTIQTDIDLEADKPEFEAWYDYTVRVRQLGDDKTPNFRSWIKGCPRMSEDQLIRMETMQRKFIDAIQEWSDSEHKNNE